MVLFSATVAVVLMVYILDDVTTARRLFWGLIISDLALSGLAVLFGLHLDNPTTIIIYNLPRQFFLQDSRVLTAGTVALAGGWDACRALRRTSITMRPFPSLAAVLSAPRGVPVCATSLLHDLTQRFAT